MYLLRRAVLLALPLLALARDIPIPDPSLRIEHERAALAKLLDGVPKDAILAAFHEHLAPKYQDGIFEDGLRGIEAVYHDDPELATRLAHIAAQEAAVRDILRKRQSNNSTTTSTATVVVTDSSTTAISTETSTAVINQGSTSQSEQSTQESTTIAVTTTNSQGSTVVTSDTLAVVPASTTAASSATTATGVLVPVVVSSTNSQGSVVVATTSAFETTAPTSVEVAVTTTNSAGSTLTTSTLVPAAVLTETNSNGQTIITTSPLASVAVAPGGSIVNSGEVAAETTTDQLGNTVVLSASHPGDVVTTTDARGSTVVLTFTPGGGFVSQLVLQTTLLPNGQLSTITSYAVVGGAATVTSSVAGGPKPSSSGSHGYQSAFAAPTARYAGEMAAVVGGALGIAAVLL